MTTNHEKLDRFIPVRNSSFENEINEMKLLNNNDSCSIDACLHDGNNIFAHHDSFRDDSDNPDNLEAQLSHKKKQHHF